MELLKIAGVKEMTEYVAAHVESELSQMFAKCYSNTLDTTVKHQADGTTFVITGDIPAMWLRDSVCQIMPYMTLVSENKEIADLTKGLITRLIRCILLDPYANAFNEKGDGACYDANDTGMKPFLWERKYEIDSLCYPIQLSYLFWKKTGRTSHFTSEFVQACRTILQVFQTEQYHESKSEYLFERKNCRWFDTLSRGGKGALVKEGIGLIWSGFRPSDDACTYGYLIPSNMFAAVCLQYMSEILKEMSQDAEILGLSEQALRLAEGIRSAIWKYGTIEHEEFGRVYAYETDGYGQYLLMDDANVPSLLSAPEFGYCSMEDEVYQNTRRMILGSTNPYYYKGSRLKGIGSPHTPTDHVWPIALAMEGLTCRDSARQKEILWTLYETSNGTSLCHESIHVDDVSNYTREWFSWANAMYCRLMLRYLGLDSICELNKFKSL